MIVEGRAGSDREGDAHVIYDDWDAPYVTNTAPWDTGRPQPVWVRLADDGEITSPVLDCGCGSGEVALMLAERGMDVVGVDVAPTAIGRARDKARARQLSAEFVVGDVLALDQLGRTVRHRHRLLLLPRPR